MFVNASQEDEHSKGLGLLKGIGNYMESLQKALAIWEKMFFLKFHNGTWNMFVNASQEDEHSKMNNEKWMTSSFTAND